MSNGDKATAVLLGLLGLALVGGVIYAVHLIGSDTLRSLAPVVVIGGLVVALVWAVQFPLRAWRSNMQPERHVYHERVREVRHVPVPNPYVPPTPSRPSAQMPVEGPMYPELLRAAFLAGTLQPPRSSGEVVDGELRPRNATEPPTGWND